MRTSFMQNFMELNRKNNVDPKTLRFGVWDLKTSFAQFGPKKRLKKTISREP